MFTDPHIHYWNLADHLPFSSPSLQKQTNIPHSYSPYSYPPVSCQASFVFFLNITCRLKEKHKCNNVLIICAQAPTPMN